MTYPDGAFYEGDWENGKPNGFGTLKENGEIYEG
jgi:hypothetical protein